MPWVSSPPSLTPCARPAGPRQHKYQGLLCVLREVDCSLCQASRLATHGSHFVMILTVSLSAVAKLSRSNRLPEWPPSLTEEREVALLHEAIDWALSNGLVLRPAAVDNEVSSTTVIHAPFSLFPTPFPKTLYEQAISVQGSYSALYCAIASNADFLEKVIGGAVSKVDEFQGKLYEIWQQVRADGQEQTVTLGIFRSDYLMHAPTSDAALPLEIKQVEFNTISSSFGALSSKVTSLHQHLLHSGYYPSSAAIDASALPRNDALSAISKGIASAHQYYQQQQSTKAAVVLFVVQDPERNAFDQRAIEWLLQEMSVSVRRLTLAQVRQQCSLTDDKRLLLREPISAGPREISVVYYRAGYGPADYTLAEHWFTRLLLERSRAVKCPSVALQLAGAKKIQQVLTEPGMLERFESEHLDQRQIADLRRTFIALYSLEEGTEGDQNEQLARDQPSRFVLKPQREGGGNNVYREKIPPFLDELNKRDRPGQPKGREGYILMELILPPTEQKNIMVRTGEGKGLLGDTVSELGIYGISLFDSKPGSKQADMISSEVGGHLLRTKGRQDDEGGVAVGFSVIDSPFLV
ncbi:uncharacterized protein L969DRAFT_95945 [Mixia osmundae IAM 14324]|uniref:Glutathione synthetase n=1 Tax=Mixia osmundae (strain CBS 9802 / IAM 14324 / JCM 22182 / KY 12970) TaxID=764103 RepID=G7DWY5_MIXOS|nr:uncharacterized protein L969DRAFT_95945 [Mixia osmundae IAM 14324]KEI38108.1 hypothetical protein L969DRAFT_95945 [Mixia osmundae IAM 14324]GAA95082.1 hypothetical protein E5Q_01737 [Mixia osmundae IAM 14324]